LPKAVLETKALIWAGEQHSRRNGEFEMLKITYVFMQWSVYRTLAT